MDLHALARALIDVDSTTGHEAGIGEFLFHYLEQMIDRSGRRIMLVVTDTLGDSWRRNLMSPLLAGWASSMPAALVHMLPQRLWRRHGKLEQPYGIASPRLRHGATDQEIYDAFVEVMGTRIGKPTTEPAGPVPEMSVLLKPAAGVQTEDQELLRPSFGE